MAHKTIIDATKKNKIDLHEIRQYKDLFLTLTYREYRVRYAQTFLGFFWALLQPLATLLIFTFIFGRAINVNTGGVPYPIFALTGMVVWNYFSFVVSQAGRSLISNQAMIQKIYFPKIILPLSSAVVGLVDFTVTFLLLIIAMFYYGFTPSANLWFLPVFLVMAIITSVSIGILISALTIRFRDFQYIVPFIIQIGLYATPVAYSTLYIPEKYQLLYYSLNPMAGVVEGFRWCIIGQGKFPSVAFISFGIIVFTLILSLKYFKKAEKTIADII